MKKLLMMFVAIIVTLMSLKAQNFDTEKVLRHLNRAEVCLEMNKIDDAIKEYQEIVKIAHNWPNVYMYLGNAYSLKDDDLSLSKSIEYYNKFLQMTDDQELYNETQDKLARIEMVKELKAKETKRNAQLLGTWKTSLHDKYTGQPWFIINITTTPIPNQYQITLSPKSFMYNNIINTKAYSEIIDDKIAWMFTYQETYIPSQAKHNARGMLLNILAGDNNVAAAVANVVNESIRESDVGYSDINEFSFGCNVNICYDKYKITGIKPGYLPGSCYMRGEHHQNGLNQITIDSVFTCDYLRGDSKYPVLLKIEKKGRKYKYGDIVTKDISGILKDGGYVDYELERKNDLQKTCFVTGLGAVTTVLSIPTTIICGIVGLTTSDEDIKSNMLVATLVGGISMVVGIELVSIGANHDDKVYYDGLIKKHNNKVEENRKKYNSEISFVASPIGVGLQMTF